MQSKIEQKVMGNVAAIHTARQFVSASAIKLYILLGSLFALVQLTWVHRVFANWAQVGFKGTFEFLSYALLHTSPTVQITLAVVLVAGILLVRDLMRPVRHYSLAL